MQASVVALIIACLGGLTLGAAVLASAAPLYVGAGALGALLMLGALRTFPALQPVGPALWTCALLLAIAGVEGLLDGKAGEYVALVLAIVAGAALIAATAVSTKSQLDGTPELPSLALGLSTATAAALLGVAAGTTGLDDIESAASWLWVAAGASVVATIAWAIAGAFVRAAAAGSYSREFDPPPSFDVPSIRRGFERRDDLAGAADGGILGSLVAALGSLGMSFLSIGADGVNLLLKVLCGTANLAIDRAVRGARWILVTAIRAALVVAATVRQTAAAVFAAARALGPVVARWAKTTVLGLAFFGTAGVAAAVGCDLMASYLDHGPLVDGARALALAGLSVVALSATWWAISGYPAAEIARSAGRSVERGMPAVLLAAIAIGLVDGLLGLLGFGPMQPGPLTLTGIVAVVVACIVHLIRRRDPAPAEAVS